jgi:hypothetical protein
MGNITGSFGLDKQVNKAYNGISEFQNSGREVQMSIQIAQTRDMLQWGAGVWLTILTGSTIATVKQGAFPKPAAIPLFFGGVVLANMTDMAYGTKLKRVVQEAEYIREHEREMLIPLKETPFRRLFEEEVKNDTREASRVGNYWPTFVRAYLPRQNRGGDEKSDSGAGSPAANAVPPTSDK